jgi:hypothetical protein
MNASELIATLEQQGFTLIPLPEGKLAVKPADSLTDALRQSIRQCKREVVNLLTRPYLNAKGELIIPFTSAPRFHWWNGGQSIQQTLRELHAPPDVFSRYVEIDLRKIQ